MAPDTAQALADQIRNAGWMVRHATRSARLRWSTCPRRKAAIDELGLIVRRAFAMSNDFEVLLTAILDALRPTDDDRAPF